VSRNPVVLLHGIYDRARRFDPLCGYLEACGRTTHRFDLVPNNGDVGLDDLAGQVAAYVDRAFGREAKFDLVGFSMGGLVARYYTQRLGGLARISHLVTIASPHRGTWMAYAQSNKGARQMRPGSAFLRDLDTDRGVLERIRFTSIWSPWDLMILPASSSVIPDARSIAIGAALHPLMVRDRRVLRLVEQALGE
jgi:triacylglycerol lipase